LESSANEAPDQVRGSVILLAKPFPSR